MMKRSTSREEELDALIRKYTADMIQQKRATAARERPSEHTILLTGSTGSLGSHVLQNLLQRPDVKRVYCLNRSRDAATRQEHGFKKHCYPVPDLQKAKFIHSDFSVAHFGFAEADYKQLVASVTIVIHSAWSVDFNLSLSSYEDTHIAGTQRLVNFVSESVYKPPINFISSIASVGKWASVVQDGSPVPEDVTTLFDRPIVLPQGYGESKQVAAEILALASHRLGIQVAIIRASQLAGPSAQAGRAPWNRHEWLPSLVHASKCMKKLPKTLGTMEQVDWVPMDVAAAAVVDIAMAPASQSTRVYHLANPHPTSWGRLYPAIQEFYKSKGVDIDVIEYDDWVQELVRIPLTKENAEHVPGLKLREFFNSLRPEMATGLPRLVTKNTEAVSRTLREGRSVDQSDMRKWLEQWQF